MKFLSKLKIMSIISLITYTVTLRVQKNEKSAIVNKRKIIKKNLIYFIKTKPNKTNFYFYFKILF